jgi:hypothetical protein
MSSGGVADLDFIEELRLRRWARENYVPLKQREKTWHPVVHEEMTKKESELNSPADYVYAFRA